MEEREELPPGLSGAAKQALNRDMKQILSEFERDYKQDLGIHLYSAHLLHLKNAKFPQRSYTEWPLFPEEVPDPRNTRLYTPEPDEDFELETEHDINHPSRQPPLSKKRKRSSPVKSELRDVEIPSEQSDDDQISGKWESIHQHLDPFLLHRLGNQTGEGTPTSLSPNKKQKKIVSEEFVPDEILEEERDEALVRGEMSPPTSRADNVPKNEDKQEAQLPLVTDPAESMKIEIERIFKRKVHEGIFKSHRRTKRFEPVLDGLAVPDEVIDKVMHKFTSVLNRFGTSRRARAVIYNWRDVLNEASVPSSFGWKMSDVFDTGARNYLDEFDQVESDEEGKSGNEPSTDEKEENDKNHDLTNDHNETANGSTHHKRVFVDQTGKTMVFNPCTGSRRQQAEYIQHMRIQSSALLFERELKDSRKAELKELRKKKLKLEHTWQDDYGPFDGA